MLITDSICKCMNYNEVAQLLLIPIDGNLIVIETSALAEMWKCGSKLQNAMRRHGRVHATTSSARDSLELSDHTPSPHVGSAVFCWPGATVP